MPPIAVSKILQAVAACAFSLMATGALAQTTQDAEPCAFDRVIDLRTGTPTTIERVYGEASQTQLVFVGERHGTPEHVALARCVLERKGQGRPPVLALEHVPANYQSQLDDWRRNGLSDPDTFPDLVEWESLGWPDYFIYRPLIDGARSVRAHVLGTDRPAPGTRGTLSPEALLEVAPAYGLQTDDVLAIWVPDMIAAHCDLVDEATAQRMALAQMERDRIMAGRLIAGRGRGSSALYYGGRGHVRGDVAIPYLIGRTDRPPTMLRIVAFTTDEWAAMTDGQTPASLGLAEQFDIAVVAGQSAVTDAQACEEMREAMGLN